MSLEDRYRNYVAHPRYGREPRYTGLNPSPFSPGVFLHCNATSITEISRMSSEGLRLLGPLLHLDGGAKRIEETAVIADASRQLTATVAVTHYFDVDRVCRDCLQPFIFYADEQKYWYEELGLRLEIDCVRCVPCRKVHRNTAQIRQRYETLFHIPAKNADQAIEMASCCLQLLSSGIFTRKQTHRVRMLMNIAKRTASSEQLLQVSLLMDRLTELEAKGG